MFVPRSWLTKPRNVSGPHIEPTHNHMGSDARTDLTQGSKYLSVMTRILADMARYLMIIGHNVTSAYRKITIVRQSWGKPERTFHLLFVFLLSSL